MATITSQAKYHIIFLQAGHYKTLPVEDEFEAHQQIHHLNNRPTMKSLGVFDPRDLQFHWSIPEQDRQEHLDQVSKLIKELQRGI